MICHTAILIQKDNKMLDSLTKMSIFIKINKHRKNNKKLNKKKMKNGKYLLFSIGLIALTCNRS